MGEVGLADSDRAVEDHCFVRFDEPQRGEVVDVRGGYLGVVGEVEVLDGGDLFEVSLANSADERRRVG